MEINTIVLDQGELFEGCVWLEDRQSVIWVDIPKGIIWEYSTVNNITKNYDLGGYIGTVIPTTNKNCWLVAKDKSLQLFYPEKNEIEDLFSFPFVDGIRFNDGKCDPFGQVFVGSMAIDQSNEKLADLGALYCFSDNNVNELEKNIIIPNGLAWSKDKKIFYHVDSVKRTVSSYEYEDSCLKIGNKKTVIVTDEKDGTPDGMCIDEEDNLWIAMWGGGKVICVDPKKGKKITEIKIPDINVSCCTFGGCWLNQMFVTTAKDDNGNGGSLYKIDIGIKGTLPCKYNFSKKQIIKNNT